ncbi:phosphatase PAP2 family protein [Effusibacillus dendaii]|uniref:Phosphatase PAP2 family protein n=1 Tax=Effusibacillus dendaii TaxID=2743772 RepID=A0A7I8DCM8_9BACL|nr:phosphatase PAP2 family protein [Effusibacillus dendaii]BCJ87845.1 phosphatase PAP2 family protein [Effusibacillus dendaii]
MQRMAEWMVGRDIRAFRWINGACKCSFFEQLMPVVTHLGGTVFSIGMSLVFLLQSDPYWRYEGVHLAISLLFSHLIVAACKKLLPRHRPYQVLENVFTGRKLLTDASFPSGHSTAAFCSATVLSIAFPVLSPGLYALAALTASSRVYLGLHYPSDVAIGAVLGTAVPLWLA